MFEFLDFDYLSVGEIDLVIEEKAEEYELKNMNLHISTRSDCTMVVIELAE